MGRFSEMSTISDYPTADEFENQIKHISLLISKEWMLMRGDTGGHGELLTIGNNFSTALNTDSKEKADTSFEKLSTDGKVTMTIEEIFRVNIFGCLLIGLRLIG